MMKASLCFLGLLCGGTLSAQTWSHDPSAANGPKNWGLFDNYSSNATCGTASVNVGKKQTPVDISTKSAVQAVLPPLRFHYRPVDFKVLNLLHTIEVEYQQGSSIQVGPSVLNSYKLLQFHLHAPSEHTIDGKHTAAELHLVHQNKLGELAVVGVMLEENDATANPTLSKLIFGAPSGVAIKTEHEVGGSVNAADLLPKSHKYFAYTGSLTTPPCSEGVHWFVMSESVRVSKAAVSQLHKIVSQFPGYNGFPDNNRPVMSLNGRTILASH